jgi:hypothetical protein
LPPIIKNNKGEIKVMENVKVNVKENLEDSNRIISFYLEKIFTPLMEASLSNCFKSLNSNKSKCINCKYNAKKYDEVCFYYRFEDVLIKLFLKWKRFRRKERKILLLGENPATVKV